MVIPLNSTSILTSQQNVLVQVCYFPSFIVAILSTVALRAEMHHDTSRADFLCLYGARCARMQRNILKETTQLVEAELANSKWTNHQPRTL